MSMPDGRPPENALFEKKVFALSPPVDDGSADRSVLWPGCATAATHDIPLEQLAAASAIAIDIALSVAKFRNCAPLRWSQRSQALNVSRFSGAEVPGT
jgi:hypothetical protein